jgi:hypothetical protein
MPTRTLLIDDLDFKPNAHVMGIFFDEQLVSTIRDSSRDRRAQRDSVWRRVAVSRCDDPRCSMPVQTFIDPVRFAADPEIMREYPASALL